MRVRKIQKRNILPGTRAVRRGNVAAFVFRMRPICRRLYVFATAFNITKEEERVEQKKIRHNKKKKQIVRNLVTARHFFRFYYTHILLFLHPNIHAIQLYRYAMLFSISSSQKWFVSVDIYMQRGASIAKMATNNEMKRRGDFFDGMLYGRCVCDKNHHINDILWPK